MSPLRASTSTEVSEPQLNVTTRKQTAKQKERDRVKAQTPEKQKINDEKKISTIRIRRNATYNKQKMTVIQETSSSRSHSQVTNKCSSSTDSVQEESVGVTTTVESNEAVSEWPNSEMLTDFEDNPTSALLLFHETTGLYRWHTMNSTNDEPGRDESQPSTGLSQHFHTTINQIGNGISSTVKDHCIATFQEQVNYLSSLLACGACGIRSFTTQDGRKVTLTDPLIQLLRLNKEDMEQHDSLGVYKNVCSIFLQIL